MGAQNEVVGMGWREDGWQCEQIQGFSPPALAHTLKSQVIITAVWQHL
jgi:hypothetical protein